MSYRFDQYDNSIVFEGFENGIADSPFSGISDMRNVNINSIPGEAAVNFKMSSVTKASSTGNVLSGDGTDRVTVTYTTGAVVAGTAVVFAGGSLPGGIVAGTVYWAGSFDGADKFRLFTTPDLSGAQITLTTTGTGTFSTIDMGKPMYKASTWKSATASAEYYIIDSNGRAWKFITTAFTFLGNTTLTSAHGNGIAVWKGYLFVFRDAVVDYMNTTTFAWTYGWKNLNTTAGVNNSHYCHIGQDDAVYFCDTNYVGSILEVEGKTFSPSDSTTYNFTNTALGLPYNEVAQCLEELGINLLVGGIFNRIYPWDRSSTSYSYPILLAESNVFRMKTVNTNTYILAGRRGRIYVSNGSQAQVFKKVPDHISNTVEPYFTWGDLDSFKNQLYFGLTAQTNGGTVVSQYGGLWGIDLDTKAIRLSNKLSYDTYAGIASVVLPIIFLNGTTTDGLGAFVGWDSGASTYGVDIGASTPYTGSQAVIETDLAPVGTYDKPHDFTRIEYRLTAPLVSGESIVISARTNFTYSYTQVFSDSTVGAYSISQPVNFKNPQWLQLKATLNSTGSSPSYVRLKEIRLR